MRANLARQPEVFSYIKLEPVNGLIRKKKCKMSLKYCYFCKTEKNVEEFYKNFSKKDGYSCECKSCIKNKNKEYYNKNKESITKKHSIYYRDNKEHLKNKMRIYGKQYYKNNIEYEKERKSNMSLEQKDKRRRYFKKYQQTNKFLINNYTAQYRARKAQNSPSFLSTIHLQQIQWYYKVAEMFTRDMGKKYEVDHIHPLRGKNFSGLHVPWNLRVIPTKENRKKSNYPPAHEAHLFWS
jgi:hypothetical protein